MTDMWIENLSNNSAEHYYLISEIEQKAELILLNKLAEEETPTKIVQHAMTFLYTLWQPEEEDNKLVLKKLQQLTEFAFNTHKLDISSSAIVIDALISTEKGFDQQMKERVQTLFQDIELLLPGVGLIIIGIVDSSAGTPGLEKLHDLIERILPGYVKISKLANIIAVSDLEMMGHDPTRDPDGESNVQQRLCYPNPDMETKYLLTVFSNKTHTLHNLSEEKQIRDIAAWEYFFGYLIFYLVFVICLLLLVGYIYLRWFETSE